MIQLENYISRFFNISAEESQLLARLFKAETIKKGDYFLRAGAQCDKFSFIQEGILRIYVQLPDKEVTQWISTRESFVTEFNSFFYRNPALFNIQALTDTHLLTIDYEQYQQLANTMQAWAAFEKLFIGKCFVFLESRVFDLISLSAEERYSRLFEQNRELFNQVPLRYLASMLGMTPETFSRIRKKQVL